MKTLRSIRIEYALVPVLLIGIALNQMRLVRSVNLSPWKGGGFGMFSTTDSPGGRRVICTARMADGGYFGIELDSCKEVSRELRRLLTLPTDEALEGLGKRVLAASMVPVDYTNRSLVEHMRESNPDTPLDVNVYAPASLNGLSWLRPLSGGDPIPREGEYWQPRAVKLQLVSVRWDQEEARISVEHVLDPLVLTLDSKATAETKS